MACPGLHCACCSGGMAVPPVALVAAYGVVWVVEHIVEIAIMSAVCGVLAVVAVVMLVRWQDRRQARHGPLMAYRAEVLDGQPIRHGVADSEVPGLSSTPRPAIGPAAVHFHFHGQPDAETVAAVRRAIDGRM